jgi:glycosyltransferase involved in cell wall biosynthesis
MAQLIAALANRHRVALLYLRGHDEPPIDDGIRARCELVEEVTRGIRDPFTQRWLQHGRVVLARLKGNPRWVAEWWVPFYETRVRTLVRTWQPDIVQIEFHVMGQYLAALSDSSAPRVLIEHDPGAVTARDRQRLQRGLRRSLTHLEVRAWERYEERIMREVQAVVVFTDRDRKALAPLAPHVPLVRIPIGTVLPEQPLNPLGRPPPSIVFLGSFIHPPNTDAAARLIRGIFPRVRAQCPEVVLYVIGDQPPAEVRNLAGENVVVTGRVGNVSPYLDRAALIVVPLRLGGGMRVKVLEALAAGKAVVASPLAVEGLNVTAGEQVMLAETDQEFCDVIGSLLRDPHRRGALAQRARAWACANLGWENSVAAYERLYASLTMG